MRLKQMRLPLIALATMLALVWWLQASATNSATSEEAQAMCEKAAALIQSEGFEKAKEAFQDRSSQFFDRNLYVFVFDKSGRFVAHGREPLLIGLNGYNMRDIYGNQLVRHFLEVKDRGWVDYNWADPADGNKLKPKSSYIIHVGDYFVGVGYYKDKNE